MKISRLRVALSPRWLLLDASVTIALDGVAIRECGLTEGAEVGPLDIESGTHELSALLVGVVRRKTALRFEVKPHREVTVEIGYSRMTGKLSMRTVSDRPLDVAAAV